MLCGTLFWGAGSDHQAPNRAASEASVAGTVQTQVNCTRTSSAQAQTSREPDNPERKLSPEEGPLSCKVSQRGFFALVLPSSGRNSLAWERLEMRALGSLAPGQGGHPLPPASGTSLPGMLQPNPSLRLQALTPA